jgi:crotonobetainyl-CoA:carnitine CoA-transferase CaiB-like acyl-CoA transferase
LALEFFGCGEVQAAWELQGRMLKRAGRERVAINLKDGKVIYGDILWPCKDGDLAFTLGFGVWREKGNTAFVQWMKSEGYDVGSLEHWDFKTKDWSSVEEEEAREVLNIIGNFFLNHTKMEILEKALEIGLWMGLSLTVEDMVSFKHFKERDFFAEVAYPQLNASLTHPGPPVRFSDAACGIRCRAPFLGEHNNEIYVDELGFSEKHLSDLRERGVV